MAQPAPAVAPAPAFSVNDYISELDKIGVAASEMVHPDDAPRLLKLIPASWRIETPQGTFAVSCEALRRDLIHWQKKPDKGIQSQLVARLQSLRAEAASSLKSPTDVSPHRAQLGEILARKEFQDVHGPTWLDRLKQRIMQKLLGLLGRLFGSSVVPTIGRMVVYLLITLAVLALAFWMYRTIRNGEDLQTILPGQLPVSSKEWRRWMAEARAAADAGNWRDAVHLGYWCGISFLEGQGLWRPDTARTPREYLRLLPPTSERREALTTLTRSFERVWYGTHAADAQAFFETLAQLEKLGCHSN